MYARIRFLENLLIKQLPPQLNLGEYDNLVRDNLNQAWNVLHYQRALYNELFDITVLELKANLRDRLFNLLMPEPDKRVQLILRESPFPERKIRSEALEFIARRLDLLNLGNPHPYANPEKVILQTMLEQWLNNLRKFFPKFCCVCRISIAFSWHVKWKENILELLLVLETFLVLLFIILWS